MAAPEWLVKLHSAILIWSKRQANPAIVVIKSPEDCQLHRLNYRQSFAGQETTLYKGRRAAIVRTSLAGDIFLQIAGVCRQRLMLRMRRRCCVLSAACHQRGR
jgi:hypothetical protein